MLCIAMMQEATLWARTHKRSCVALFHAPTTSVAGLVRAHSNLAIEVLATSHTAVHRFGLDCAADAPLNTHRIALAQM